MQSVSSTVYKRYTLIAICKIANRKTYAAKAELTAKWKRKVENAGDAAHFAQRKHAEQRAYAPASQKDVIVRPTLDELLNAFTYSRQTQMNERLRIDVRLELQLHFFNARHSGSEQISEKTNAMAAACGSDASRRTNLNMFSCECLTTEWPGIVTCG